MPWSRRTPFRTDDQIGHLWWLLVACIATTPRECLPSPRTEADEHAGDASLPRRQSHCNGLDAHRPDQPVCAITSAFFEPCRSAFRERVGWVAGQCSGWGTATTVSTAMPVKSRGLQVWRGKSCEMAMAAIMAS